MSDERKCFTFIWKIKNFEFTFNKDVIFESPMFYVHEMFGTFWVLLLYSYSSNHKNRVACYLERKSSSAFYSNDLPLGFELSFINNNESVIYSRLVLSTLFEKGVNWISPLSADREEVYRQRRQLFIPDGTLTIRCRMWKNQGSMTRSARCSVETQIDTKCVTFVGTIDNFSSINPNSRNRVSIKSQSDDFRISSMHLYVGENGKLDVEIKPTGCHFENTHKVNVFIVDDFENKVKSCIGGIYIKEPFCILLTFSKDHLIENKELYLPNDVLTLKCEVIFSSIYELEQIGDMIYEYESQDIPLTFSNSTSPNPYIENYTDSIITLRNGLLSLFNEGIFCDTKLKTATEAFPAHKVVLSAQSPVFKSMFSTDMKEKTNSSVDIEDLDADTVRQMLLFLYLGTLNNLEYESATSLYFAADKYDIVSLKQKCSNFLMNSLLPSNCCEVLLLANKHQDIELKRYAFDYIAKNDETVFSSDKWKELEENKPRLIIETLRAVHSYMKKRRNYENSSVTIQMEGQLCDSCNRR